MRYMLMFKTDQEPPPGQPACKQNLPEMAKVLGELRQRGVLLATEGLMPSWTGARVRYAGGRLPVTDGPFAEAKELVAGFAIVNVHTKAEAIALAQQFLRIAGEGECDILQCEEYPSAGG